MTTATRYYATVREARNALALDTGFDPFISGGWGRCTKQKLADAGYPVDAAEVRRARQEEAARAAAGLCKVCGAPSEREMFCAAHGIGNCGRCGVQHTGYCHTHQRYSFTCDHCHRVMLTEDEARAQNYTCKVCGEYFV